MKVTPTTEDTGAQAGDALHEKLSTTELGETDVGNTNTNPPEGNDNFDAVSPSESQVHKKSLLRSRIRKHMKSIQIMKAATDSMAINARASKKQRGNFVGGNKPHDFETYDAIEAVSYESVGKVGLPSTANKGRRGRCCGWLVENFSGTIVWVLPMGLGVVVSLVTNFLIFLFYKLVSKKDAYSDTVLASSGWVGAVPLWLGIGVGAGAIAILSVLLYPAAAASGIPAVLGYLNGVKPVAPLNMFGKTTPVFSFNVMVAKFVGTVASMSTGLFIGPEGPIIHIGAIIGELALEFVEYLETQSEEMRDALHEALGPSQRRDFFAIGAGAGIAGAFSAPLAGVMFVAEEAASVLTVQLIETAFFACASAFWITWLVTGGSDKEDGHVKFNSPSSPFCGKTYTVRAWLIFVLLGILGGMLGALFNAIVVKLNHWRKHNVQSPCRRIGEGMGVILLTLGTVLLLSASWGCTELTPNLVTDDSLGCLPPEMYTQVSSGIATQEHARLFYLSQNLTEERKAWIKKLDMNSVDMTYLAHMPSRITHIKIDTVMQASCPDGYYNELATMLLRSGTNSVRNLFMRGVPHLLSLSTLCIFLVVYFLLAAMTSGTSLPSGLFVPQILIGAAMGRIVSLLEIYFLREHCNLHPQQGDFFDWVYSGYKENVATCDMPDPGAYATIGAAAFLGGSGRITVFLAVVMLELTNDIKLLPVLATTVFVAVWTGNVFNHGLYHALTVLQSVPFLNPSASVEMRFYPVSMVMEENVDKLQELESPASMRRVMMSTHNAFPVVNGLKRLLGVVSRGDLEKVCDEADKNGTDSEHGGHIRVPLTNCVPTTVYEDTSIAKAYDTFRLLGLRHLCVINRKGVLVGLVTRKDLMLWKLHEKIGKEQSDHGWIPASARHSHKHELSDEEQES